MKLLLHLLLALHICGLVIMAGTTVVDFFTFRTFCSMLHEGDSHAPGMLPIMSRYGTLVRTGAVMLLLSGLAMVIMKTQWWTETWFKVKLFLVFALVLNGMFTGNKLGIKFRRLAWNNLEALRAGSAIITNMNRFYLLQLALFMLIILVSIFRPMGVPRQH